MSRSIRYDIRVELPTGDFFDHTQVTAENYMMAQMRFRDATSYEKYDWRGMVCFVDGALPAEEKVHMRKVGMLPPLGAPQGVAWSVRRA